MNVANIMQSNSKTNIGLKVLLFSLTDFPSQAFFARRLMLTANCWMINIFYYRSFIQECRRTNKFQLEKSLTQVYKHSCQTRI